MSSANTPGALIERRERRRFPVRLALDVRCGHGESSEAVLRDASESGISFLCDMEMPTGSPIEFSVHVPEGIAEQERIFVRGRGTVVRSEQHSMGRVLVAVATDRYEFNE